jgi:acetyl-CoA carboxylase carboxyltransferase component
MTAAVDSSKRSTAALARLEALCDRGSVRLIRTATISPHLGDQAFAGDGVVAGAGEVGGRTVFCFAQDGSRFGGSLGQAHAETIVHTLSLARRAGAPVVGFLESAGARLQEGSLALEAYGRVFQGIVELSGLVPQVTVVTGPSAGGGAYAAALTDFVVMTRSSAMFLTGPKVVRQAMGEEVSMADLGGQKVQTRNGVAHLLADDDAAACRLTRELLSYLPPSAKGRPALVPAAPPERVDPAEALPEEGRKVYDVRDVCRGIFDGGAVFEISPRWARNMLTAFARLGGRTVGIVANQPRYLGGVIDATAAEKGAGFVDFCDAYGIPLVVLVDTAGFLPGVKQEKLGVIRHGAGLLRAFASARVPSVTLILRKAYGGAFITMNSRALGAHVTYAWPAAEIGIMTARSSVLISQRRSLCDERDLVRRSGEYHREHISAEAAARRGVVDQVIDPLESRSRLLWALDRLAGPGEELGVTGGAGRA